MIKAIHESIMDIQPYVGGKSQGKPGQKIIKLSSNESQLGPSPKAIEAYKNAADSLHRYPDGGSTALREAIATVHNIPANQVVCGAGSDEVIEMLMHGFVGAEQEVLISQHGFLMYEIYAKAVGATPVYVDERNLKTDVDAMLAAVNSNTKLVCIANPNNPTGSYLTKDELHRLHAGLPKDTLLLVDCAYGECNMPADYSNGSELVNTHDNVIMTRSFSKMYGLGGLRVGWGYACANIIDIINRIRGPFNVSSAAIATATAAMLDTAHTQKAADLNSEGLKYLNNAITQLGFTVHPSIANFVLVEFASADEATAANAHLAEDGIIVRSVAGYGLAQCLRISVGLAEDNQAVITSLTNWKNA